MTIIQFPKQHEHHGCKTLKEKFDLYSEIFGILSLSYSSGIKGFFPEGYEKDNALICMNLAAKESFSGSTVKSSLKTLLEFCALAEKFMGLSCQSSFDDLYWAVACIKYNIMNTLNGAYRSSMAINRVTERELEDKVVASFCSIKQFQGYSFVGRQVVSPCGDRIDIMAKEDSTGRPVIIELKRGKVSAHKQLRSYAAEYESPILINISEGMPISLRKGIIYLTFSQLEIHGKTLIPATLRQINQ